ncbi:MAG TPA: ATP-binding cassette domain-containing protein, partial [Terriglobales bacterium]|nr:ATP-binding cassette domain-containing protein [Terriglobales bacterium]
MIQLRNVERAYKTAAGATYVLRRINLDVREGEFVTVMGPSGSGKSTLLSIVGMLDDSWTGEYYLLEHQVHKLDRKKRADLNR